jgi:protein-tyrosine phosphatase
MMRDIMMVCTANICRSPIAEAVWFHLNPQLNVFSRGIHAVSGAQAASNSKTVCDARGMPIAADKRAIQLTQDDIRRASLILVMDQGHKHELHGRYPAASGKTFLIGHWGNFEVPDPVGQPLADFEASFELIHKGALAWTERVRRM